MPVLAVADLNGTVKELLARGWQSEGEAFEIPAAPAYRFVDPSGNPYDLFLNDRPEAMERATPTRTMPTPSGVARMNLSCPPVAHRRTRPPRGSP